MADDDPFGNIRKILLFRYLVIRRINFTFAFVKSYGHKIIALGLLLLFATYWSSITLFPHAHRIGDRVYVHSHPFADANSHTHSEQQLQVIEYLSLLLVTSVAIATAVIHLTAIRYYFKVPVVVARQSSPIRVCGLRAPPVMA